MLLALCSVSVAQEEITRAEYPSGVFASVAGEYITTEQYHVLYSERMRQRFYHGKIPDAEIASFGEHVLQELVDRVLLRQEALRRGHTVDSDGLQRAVDAWRTARGGGVTPELERLERQRLRDDLLAERLREGMKSEIPYPADDLLVRFYEENLEKFTRPEQLRVSLILLKVAPYELAPVWQRAYEQAQSLLERLSAGDDFAVLAEKYSQHESSVDGGDLGLVHAGMLSSEVQDIVSDLPVGKVVDEPVVLLQGIALLRVDERRPATVIGFEQAKARVGALLLKEMREQVWFSLLEELRESNPVVLVARQ